MISFFKIFFMCFRCTKLKYRICTLKIYYLTNIYLKINLYYIIYFLCIFCILISMRIIIANSMVRDGVFVVLPPESFLCVF